MGEMWAQWPARGRVGVSRAKATEGQHVFVVTDSADEHWIVLCEYPAERFSVFGIPASGDNYPTADEDVAQLLRDWAVEWLPPGPSEEEIEQRVFDIRRDIDRTDRRRASPWWRWWWRVRL